MRPRQLTLTATDFVDVSLSTATHDTHTADATTYTRPLPIGASYVATLLG